MTARNTGWAWRRVHGKVIRMLVNKGRQYPYSSKRQQERQRWQYHHAATSRAMRMRPHLYEGVAR